MSNALTVVKTIDGLVVEITGHIYDLHRAENRCNKLRLSAGLKLLELRHLVEAEGEDWWDWWEANKDRLLLHSRKDSERLMRIASAEDPEAALANERAKDRDRKRLVRSFGADKADVRSIPQAMIEQRLAVQAELEARGHYGVNAVIFDAEQSKAMGGKPELTQAIGQNHARTVERRSMRLWRPWLSGRLRLARA